MQIPPGCARYTVRLSKPLGMVLEERSTGGEGVKKIVGAGRWKEGGRSPAGQRCWWATPLLRHKNNWGHAFPPSTVAELVPDGAAARSGEISVGDEVRCRRGEGVREGWGSSPTYATSSKWSGHTLVDPAAATPFSAHCHQRPGLHRGVAVPGRHCAVGCELIRVPQPGCTEERGGAGAGTRALRHRTCSA